MTLRYQSPPEEPSLSTIALVPFTAQTEDANVKILALDCFKTFQAGLSLSVSKLSIMPPQVIPEDLAKEISV